VLSSTNDILHAPVIFATFESKATMRKTLLLLFIVLIGSPTWAQKALTLSDAVLKAYSEFAPERVKGLQWIEGGATYSYLKDGSLMKGMIGSAADLPLLDLASFNANITDSVKVKSVPQVEWLSPTQFRYVHRGSFCTYDLGTKSSTCISLTAEAEHVDIAPVSGAIAYTVENNLFIQPTGANEASVQLTQDGADGIVNGKSVHRQEYGIVKGTFWDPKGEKLAFYRMDETMVSPYFLEDIGTTPSTFDKIRYPMAGGTSHHVTVGVYDRSKKTTVFLRTGEPLDQYLTNISWDTEGRYVHVVHLDRKTENLRLVRYDISTGEPLATLLEEHSDKYLEPEHPAQFLKSDPNKFLWRSERDGWDHVYLYDVKKGLQRQLTKGNWLVKDVVALDPKETFMIVEGTAMIEGGRPTGAMETQLYRVELSSGKTRRLTKEEGMHHGQLSSDGTTLIDTWSSLSVPGRTVLRDAGTGSITKDLLTSKDPFIGMTIGTVETLVIPGENGDFMNARLIKPSGFDATRKYPVLIYLYNGPHLQLVTNSFFGGGSTWMYEAAERGYLVWTVDGHGSDYRGRDYEQAVFRQLGITEVKDQMRGVAFLKTLPYVDGERFAVHGWSFGGHMTTALLARNPGVFKVGVAGGPVMDWSMYEVMYTERYMDTPVENPEGYKNTTLPLIADKLQDDLLIISGGKDDTVLPEHSYRFLKACVDSGTQVDFFNYPGHGHNVRGKDRLHLMTKVLDHIDSLIQPKSR